MYSTKEYVSNYADTREYGFIWHRDDWKAVMSNIVQEIYSLERTHTSHSFVRVFFKSGSSDEVVQGRQRRFLESQIEARCRDVEYMTFLFFLISSFPPDQIVAYVAVFLEHNEDFEDFNQLRIEWRNQDGYSSRVARHQEQLDFFESLLPLFDSAALLEHKAQTERYIRRLQELKEEAKRIEFLGLMPPSIQV
ncbi:MAG: hypothetical protein GY719_29015 [bacterium]|nr:hypothetical protein [bacterium]